MKKVNNQKSITGMTMPLVVALLVAVAASAFFYWVGHKTPEKVGAAPATTTLATATEVRAQVKAFYDRYRARTVDIAAQRDGDAYDKEVQQLLRQYLISSLVDKVGHGASYDYVLCAVTTVNSLAYSPVTLVGDAAKITVSGTKGSYHSEANVTVRRTDLRITGITCPQN